MKKLQKYILIAIIIIFALFNLNTIMNILVYNTAANAYVNYNSIDDYVRPSLMVIFNFLISFSFATIVSKILKPKAEDNNVTNGNKKERIIVSLIYVFSFIAFNALFFLKYIQATFDINLKILDYSIFDLLDSYVALGLPKYNLLIGILCCLAIIPAIIKLNLLPKTSEKNNKVLKFVNGFGWSFLVVVLLACNIYLYVDIPEFEYAYYICESDKTKEKYVGILGYSNYMENFTREFEMPDKILNKAVFYTAGLEKDNVYISSNISWESVKDIFKTTYPNFYSNYIMIGKPDEWLIENNQLFNKDKTEMIIRKLKDQEYLYIPDTVEKIGNALVLIDYENDIVVDEKNEKFFSYDGSFYANTANKMDWSTLVDFEPEEATVKTDVLWCISPKNKMNILLKEDIAGTIVIASSAENANVVIPATLTNDISFGSLRNNLVVEEGNPVYSVIDGDLYNKDATKLINLNINKDEYKILPTVKEFSASAISDICSSRVSIVDKDNENFVYENNILYNNDKTKVIFTNITFAETEPIDANLEIDENFKKMCEEHGLKINYINE